MSTPLTDPTPSDRPKTRDRLLDAAESLFAEYGFDGTSMRALAQKAGASLSATNYHFGSKEALVEAAMRRRVEPLNALRFERLAILEASDSPPTVEAILDAFLLPVFERLAVSVAAGRQPSLLAARLYSDPSKRIALLNANLFRDVDEAFLGALARALPNRDRADLSAALQLTIGLLVHLLSGHVGTTRDSRTSSPALPGRAVPLLLDYAAAGLRSVPLRQR